MDSLILTFNKEQIKTYNELLNKENVELNFNTELPEIERFYIMNFDEVISNIDKEARSLLKYNKQSSSFAAFLTQEEIKAFVPIYYASIRNIKYHCSKISGEAWKISFKIGEINGILDKVNKRYADFLPYKAALCNRAEYSLKINETEAQFKQSIEILDNLKNELLALFEQSQKVSDIVNNFIVKSSKASDEPKFKKFDAYDFFWSVEAFAEQIKNL